MIIEVNGLTKKYGDLVAVDNFDLQVAEGEILGLLGPNGSGKTTVINTILSLLRYQSGEIKVFGEQLDPDRYDLKARIGVVPQELAFFTNLTVYQNIDYFCGLYINDKAQRRQYVDGAIQYVDINKYRKFLPKQLSGGLKRRLNVACGIAHRPELIFLDEPTVAVDAQSRQFLLDNIKNLRDHGSTIVYTTHYLEEAEYLCDRIVIMDAGRSIASGTANELKHGITVKEKVTVTFDQDYESLEERLNALSNVLDVHKLDERKYLIRFQESNSNLKKLLDYFSRQGINFLEVYNELPSLNDVFFELTGKELRE
ncbi:MAG: ABC transporter ATP-binding protein [Clostridiaceae bacterium]|jgi:ABC-2 type transport system ATP-binding protein|nr:ABC transporter ATP-binding protein [Clostridiaceae bacterium]